MTARITITYGDLVCLARPDEAAACRALMHDVSHAPGVADWTPKWKSSGTGNPTAGFYSARVTVFRLRGGYAFLVTGDGQAFSRTFATEVDAVHSAALSLYCMRQTGSWSQEWRAKHKAEAQVNVAAGREAMSHLKLSDLAEASSAGVMQEFDLCAWRIPDHETALAFGWKSHLGMTWLPKSMIQEIIDPEYVLVRKFLTDRHDFPLQTMETPREQR